MYPGVQFEIGYLYSSNTFKTYMDSLERIRHQIWCETIRLHP